MVQEYRARCVLKGICAHDLRYPHSCRAPKALSMYNTRDLPYTTALKRVGRGEFQGEYEQCRMLKNKTS